MTTRTTAGILLTALLAALPAATPAPADDAGPQNVALTTLGATAKGSGAPFNKDWPAIRALRPGRRGGTIFGHPMEGGRVDIRLVVPVDIVALELIGLDYHGTRQPKAVDIHVEGEKVKHVELPERPGKPVRVALEARAQHLAVTVTDVHPRRTRGDGRKGPPWGGWQRIRVLSTTDVRSLMADVDAYDVTPDPADVAPTSGSVAEGAVEVRGRPRVTEGHPCTLWDAEDIARYRKLMETSAELRKQYAGLKQGMDERIARPVNVPEPVKGKDGKWTHLPSRKVGGVQNALACEIANLGAVYALSGEAKYGEFCKKLLLAYADALPNYAPGGRFHHDKGLIFDQRLGDATWLIQVARGYDLIYNLPSITDAQRKRIEEDCVKLVAEYIAANRALTTAPTNWAAIGAASCLMAGYATDTQELIDIGLYGRHGSKDDVKGGAYFHFGPECIDADGMWAEGAMGYQFMAMEALVTYAEVCWHHGIDFYRYRDAAFKRLFDSPLRYAYPNLKTPAIHDSGYGSIVGREAFLYEFGYRRYRDPKYLLILDQAGTHLDAQFQKFPVSVLYDRQPDADAPAIEWESVNFFGVGYGILRNTTPGGTVSLLMDYGPNRSHGHPDKLNVDLWAFNGRLIPDPGSVWYEDPLYKRWYRTTLAHNTLCVDELDQTACGADLLVYAPADTFAMQRAKTNEAYAGVLMDRAVFLTPEYLADLFGAFGRVQRKMDLCWHLRGEAQTDLPMQPKPFPKPVNMGYVELADVRRATTDKPWAVTVRRQGHAARLLAAGGTATEAILARGRLGMERPAAIIQRRMTPKTVYGNAVDISGRDDGYVRQVRADGGLDAGCALLTVTTARGEDLCFAAYRPGTHEVGPLRTDAKQAFVLRDGEAVRAAYLGGGKMLRVGALTLTRSQPGLAYLERAENGSYILANRSDKPAQVTVDFPPLAEMEAHDLAPSDRRVGEPRTLDEPGKAVAVAMAPASRIEFARKGAAGMYEHRQQMLRERLAARKAAERKARQAALERTGKREAAAKADPVPDGTVVVVQAEDFTGQGNGEVRLSETKRNIIGKAFLKWDATGHWLEWTVDAPHEGYYHLSVLYCTELDKCRRKLEVNGEVVEPAAPLVFASTGGWANQSDDWRLFTAPNPHADHPLLIPLKKGRNVIRLTNTNGRGVNLDYLAVTSPDVKITRELLAERLRK